MQQKIKCSSKVCAQVNEADDLMATCLLNDISLIVMTSPTLCNSLFSTSSQSLETSSFSGILGRGRVKHSDHFTKMEKKKKENGQALK